MIAYNNRSLYNLYVHQQADEALNEACITPEMHESIYKVKELKFYTPNFFVRIGLALLTLVIISFAAGLFGLMFGVSDSGWFLFVFMGACCYVAAELFIRSKFHYNSGVDNMLVWMAAFFVWLGFYWATENPRWYGNGPGMVTNADIKLSFVAVIIFSAMAVRFADTLLSIAATVALLCFLFYCYQHTGFIARTTTPFVMIIISGALYFISDWAIKQRSILLYHYCLRCVNVVAVIALYASGNYYLVKELSNEVFHLGLKLQDPLPMGWFFWIWTFLIPFIYIGFGIRNKNIILIRTGIPLIAIAVLTFRYYHSILSPEMAMLISGLFLFVISFTLIKYFRTPKAGFTFKPENYTSDKPEIGKLITGELINNSTQPTDNHGSNTW